MNRRCTKCGAGDPGRIRFGHFIRKSDQRKIQRYRCRFCRSVFSDATFQECYRQKKRRFNRRIFELLCSGVSQRRAAKILKLNRKTIVRKFLFLAEKSKFENLLELSKRPLACEIQFDDLETIEHTKMKPLSVTMAVERSTRKILGFSVSQMPAKGLLARKSRKKYGPRPDCRPLGRKELFQKIALKVNKGALIESDSNPHYLDDVKKYFPHATHVAFPGGRAAIAGQGELKKLKFDPLFTLNHTFAMFRANINRLFRKTWCTTKRPDRLQAHIEMYVQYHNNVLLKA